MERDPIVEGALRAVRADELARREAEAEEQILEHVRSCLPSTTRITREFHPDRDDYLIALQTGSWATIGRIVWISPEMPYARALWLCLLRTAQQHMLELAHRRGGYS